MSEPDRLATLQAENTALRTRLAELEPIVARYRALCAITPNLTLVVDRDGRYIDIDRTPYFTEAMIAARLGTTVHANFPAELAEAMVAAVRRALATGTSQHMEYQVPLPGLTDIRHAAIITPLSADTVLWFAQDVTAARQLERAEHELRTVQSEALRELSTPLLPLADGVIAMPLIGTLDAARAQQVMEKLLEGVSRLRAHTAILDITGVRSVDADAADALLRVASATRLLGARVILTGIAPDVARTLVDLQADLAGITTRDTLRGGIADALHPGRASR